MPEKEPRLEGAVQVKLCWDDISALPTLYANQVYISHAGPEFYIVFGEVQVPVLTDVAPAQLHELRVRPVAKLALTPQAMMQVAEAMANNVAAYQGRQAQARDKE